jgi:hypothetical protein
MRQSREFLPSMLNIPLRFFTEPKALIVAAAAV